MESFLLRVFQFEVLMQCRFVLFAADDLAQAEADLDAPPPHPSRVNTLVQIARVWFALQNILVPAANISKLLWGSEGKGQRSRAALRESIGVDDSSCLRSPDLRNDFEHFDQRIEQWFNPDESNVYIGRNIGPRAPNVESGGDFGHYDPSTGMVAFWEHSVSIPEIVAEVRRILPQVEAAVVTPR